MKKYFFLLAVMIFSGVFFTPVKENGLKACGKNSGSAGAVKKCRMLKMQESFGEDTDASFNMFMNPFMQ
ncbi:MAG TPA: hypothetical protein PLZ45_15965 [Ferruginibacter sp.]|nr:hypothetical protein [Ferruginibacter sp.]